MTINPDAPNQDTNASRGTHLAEISSAREPTTLEGRKAAIGPDDAEAPPRDEAPDHRKPQRKVAFLLAALLLSSIAINVYLVHQSRRLDAQFEQLDLALDRAMERIDQETVRANLAEGTLSEIDRNVDNVQERIAELQSALTRLSKASAR
jgi:cell division protein FtsL